MGQQQRHLRILPSEIDGFLLLFPAAAMPSWPPCLRILLLAYTAFVLLGRLNPAFAFRGPPGDGMLFSVFIGPIMAAAYDGLEAPWAGTIISTEVMALGSIQAILDFAVAMRPRHHVLQVGTLAIIGTGFALPVAPLLFFLGTQKVVVCWCFAKQRWGHCFSPTEGLFWAQVIATSLLCLVQGYAVNFEGWSRMTLFSSVFALIGLIFMALNAAVHAAVQALRGRDMEYAPIYIAVACVALFLSWLCTGWGGWASGTSELPYIWLGKLLHSQGCVLLLRLLVLFGSGVLCIELAAKHCVSADCDCPEKSARRLRLRVILLRKAFHALVTVAFIPPLLSAGAEFLSMILLLGSVVFTCFEAFRACRTPGLARFLNALLGKYLDAREDVHRGDLILTHLYLLIGAALPVWLESRHLEQNNGTLGAPEALRRVAGLLLIGVGDSFAAIVGVAFGRHPWPFSHHTLEGSAAYVASVFLAAAWVAGSCTSPADVKAPNGAWATLAAFMAATTLSSVLEAYTKSIDNLILPLFFCPTFRLLMVDLQPASM